MLSRSYGMLQPTRTGLLPVSWVILSVASSHFRVIYQPEARLEASAERRDWECAIKTFACHAEGLWLL